MSAILSVEAKEELLTSPSKMFMALSWVAPSPFRKFWGQKTQYLNETVYICTPPSVDGV